jgi:hypothetical protein
VPRARIADERAGFCFRSRKKNERQQQNKKHGKQPF